MITLRLFNHLTDEETREIFEIAPEPFNKNSERDMLAYAVGATMYMPSYQDIIGKLLNKEFKGLTSMVMCFEDAIREEDVERGEINVKETLSELANAVERGAITIDELPLIFVRVRSTEQFSNFVSSLTAAEADMLSGFTFPKFSARNGACYLGQMLKFQKQFKTIFYGMPILESPEIMYKETRMKELLQIKEILGHFRHSILNVRVGGTDFSSLYGIRRGIDNTMYDIMVVADALKDIINVLMRSDDGFVISAPVWEYFSNQRVLKPQVRKTPFHTKNKDEMRQEIIDKAIDGLIREVLADRANGFCGKTVIHPSQCNYVNALHAVTKEAYDDAMNIVHAAGGGVIKSSSGNKMNEMNPHMNWAKKTLLKARMFGVIKENDGYVDLF